MISIEDRTIEAYGRKIILSEGFIIQNKAEDKLDLLKTLYTNKYRIYTLMDGTDDSELLQTYTTDVLENEYLIQEAFGFKKSQDHFRFWELPKCKCPVMDNRDMFGTSMAYFSGDCPIHGLPPYFKSRK